MAKMKCHVIFLCILIGSVWAAAKTGSGKAPLDEEFGYVTVRPGAHMFWVLYHADQPGDWTDYPLIMWLQGGPGASGVGYGNFEELGPYDVEGNLREHAWTKKANLMFVDNPVGSGYSYVESLAQLTTTNEEIADDLVALVKDVFQTIPDLEAMPFFVYAESYGGKMTADFALAFDRAIKNGEVSSNFRGVALGDSWISPMDSVNTWAPFLYQMGFANAVGEKEIGDSAARTQAAVDSGLWDLATSLWGYTEGVIFDVTDGINFYNVLAQDDIYRRQELKKDLSMISPHLRQLYQNHVQRLNSRSLDDLMNGPNKERWNIPDDVVWDSQGGYVFQTLSVDFMKPVITSVEKLLNETDVAVIVFTGNLDLICDTPGTYRWIENMNWKNKASFESATNQALYIPEYSYAAAYLQEDSNNFALFTILRSGHMVPIDAPEMSLKMIEMITEFSSRKSVPEKKESKSVVNSVHNSVHSSVHNSVHSSVHNSVHSSVHKSQKTVAEERASVVFPRDYVVASRPNVAMSTRQRFAN